MRLEDNEIIETLEICKKADEPKDCINCKLNHSDNCVSDFSWWTLNLINRQKAEIERLSIENYRLKNTPLNDFIDPAKAEAIKEFAERVKAEAVNIDGIFETWEIEDMVDTLVKDMVGE